jgi:hypothetical protein
MISPFCDVSRSIDTRTSYCFKGSCRVFIRRPPSEQSSKSGASSRCTSAIWFQETTQCSLFIATVLDSSPSGPLRQDGTNWRYTVLEVVGV